MKRLGGVEKDRRRGGKGYEEGWKRFRGSSKKQGLKQ